MSYFKLPDGEEVTIVTLTNDEVNAQIEKGVWKRLNGRHLHEGEVYELLEGVRSHSLYAVPVKQPETVDIKNLPLDPGWDEHVNSWFFDEKMLERMSKIVGITCSEAEQVLMIAYNWEEMYSKLGDWNEG